MEKREEWTFLPKFTIPVVQIIVGNRYLHVLALKETIKKFFTLFTGVLMSVLYIPLIHFFLRQMSRPGPAS